MWTWTKLHYRDFLHDDCGFWIGCGIDPKMTIEIQIILQSQGVTDVTFENNFAWNTLYPACIQLRKQPVRFHKKSLANVLVWLNAWLFLSN